ncbi:MAG: 50S ribosomal protein L6 [Parcubacteria group bacterium]|nr:50S ribosomal protein L6 [Parcubacteria group bacterium]
MSRIGKNAISIPAKTEVTKNGSVLVVKGPLGELSRSFGKEVDVAIADGQVQVTPLKQTIFARALWGTTAAHLRNMIHGVNTPFVKKLIVEGVGFKSAVTGKDIVLNLGFSHPVPIEIPQGLTVIAEKNVVTISGIDKEKVGSFAALLRSKKKPEPYKGKGIRYENEVIRRKEGKKSS